MSTSTTARHGDVELAVEQFDGGTAAPVIRYDSRDAGQSTTWPVGEPGYALPDLVEDVGAVLAATGHERAHLVGVSMGGAVAQLFTLDHPSRVCSLTVISGTPGGPGHDAPDLPPMTPQMAEGERPFMGDAFDPAHQLATATDTYDRARDVAATLTNHFMIDAGPSWRQRLGEITAPTLVLRGEADALFPVEHAEALAREIPGAQLHVLSRMGHGFPPPTYWSDVLTILQRHLRTAD